MKTNHLRFVTIALVCCATLASAQSSLLCQGAYYTEEVGAEKLKQVQNSIHSLTGWQQHADSMKRQLRVGLEMEKFPKKTPLNPRFRNKQILEGYSVEAVVFESMPGFYVTGNLYKPTAPAANKSLAVIICPHGHWDKPEDYGRFRKDMQMRCAAFAKMGALVFSYDMVGYGESQQVDHEYSKVLALQTWNSIRIIDFHRSIGWRNSNIYSYCARRSGEGIGAGGDGV